MPVKIITSFVMSASDESDDAERLSLNRAGLPERFGKRRSMDRSTFRGNQRRDSLYGYDDDDIPSTKYDLMTSAERREEQARIEAGITQVGQTGVIRL